MSSPFISEDLIGVSRRRMLQDARPVSIVSTLCVLSIRLLDRAEIQSFRGAKDSTKL